MMEIKLDIMNENKVKQTKFIMNKLNLATANQKQSRTKQVHHEKPKQGLTNKRKAKQSKVTMENQNNALWTNAKERN